MLQQHDQTQRWAEQLEALRRHTLPLTVQLDQNELMKTILAQAISLLGAKSAGLYTYDPAAHELRLIADYGCTPDLIGSTLQSGEGLAGRLLASGEPYLIVDNYRAMPGHIPCYAQRCPFDAVLAVRLSYADELIGVLFVEDVPGRRFSGEEAQLLCLFGDHAAGALISNEKLRRLERLAEINSEILRELDGQTLEDRLQQIAEAAASALDAEYSGILLVSRPGVLRIAAGFGGQSDSAIGREFLISDAAGAGLTGYIASRGKLFNRHGEALTGHPAVRGVEPSHTRSGRCYSLLALPLFSTRAQQRELIGLLRVDNKRNRRGEAGPDLGFSRDDECILKLLGDAVVIAIENADLVHRLERRGSHWQLLVDSSTSSVIVNDREGRITTFSRTAEELLGYRSEQMIGHPVDRVFADPRAAREIGRLLHECEGWLPEHRAVLLRIDGVAVPVRLSASWLRDEQGRPCGTIGHFEDLRRLRRLSRTLQRLSDYMQQAQDVQLILRALVRGATAADGLGFDWAALLLYDPHDNALVGCVAAERARGGDERLDEFLQQITRGDHAPGPLEWRLSRLKLPLDQPDAAPLQQSLAEAAWLRLAPNQLQRLPPALAELPGLKAPLLLVPLSARPRGEPATPGAYARRPIGLLLAHQGGARIDDSDVEMLMAFGTTAALAYDDLILLRQSELARNAARLLAELSVRGDLQETLRGAAAEIRAILRCDVVSIIPYDQQRESYGRPISVGDWAPGPNVLRSPVRDSALVQHLIERSELAFISTIADERLLDESRFTRAQAIVSVAAGPLRVQERVVGVIFASYRSLHRFSPEEQAIIELLANQVAVAICNDQLLHESERQVEWLGIAAALSHESAASLDLSVLLQRLCARLEVQRQMEERGAIVSIRLYDPERAELVFDPHWSQSFHGQKVRQPISQGICGWVARHQQPRYVGDVTLLAPPDYIELKETARPFRTRSELAVPISYGGELIGVLDVQSRKLDAFDEDHLRFLQLLANQLAVAIHKAQEHQRRLNAERDASVMRTLAWAGMFTASRWHELIDVITATRLQIDRLLLSDRQSPALTPDVRESLITIQSHIRERRPNAMPPPQMLDEREPFGLHEMLRWRFGRLKEYNRHHGIEWTLALAAQQDTVLGSPDWLRQALDLLVYNAVEAMGQASVRRLRLSTHNDADEICLTLRDSGRGIPPELRERLFWEEIKDGPGRGLGVGAMIARVIVEKYGGTIRIAETGPDGTAIEVRLPLVHHDAAP